MKQLFICTNKKNVKRIKTYYLNLMLSIYICVYNFFLKLGEEEIKAVISGKQAIQ
jgi:hypothetical protein